MLSGKVVVVTGGAGLLGRHFCDAIVAANGVAIVADQDVEAARRVELEICGRYAGGASAASLDITNSDSLTRLISTLHDRYGRIDALVNNAYPRNQNYGRKFEDVNYDDFCENVGLHLGGYFLAGQQFAAYFKQQGHGNIINMSSIYGIAAPRFEIYDGTTMTMPVEYAAIKAGVNHLTLYMAAYFKNSGLRVNCLSPGGIKDRQPESFTAAYRDHCNSKGMLAPDDLVAPLMFLLSDGSRHMNGQNVVVDDGFTL